MKNVFVIAGACALLAVQPALAADPGFADPGFYVGADLGTMSADIDKGDLDAAIELTGTSSLDDSDTTFGVFAGYRINPNFAVEAAYLDLGEAKYSFNDEFVGAGSLAVESSGFALSALGILPVQSWELFARLGFYFGDTEGTVTVDGFGSASESKSEEELFYGVGAGYNFGSAWNVRVEYAMFKDIGDEDVAGEADVDRLTVGISYRF